MMRLTRNQKIVVVAGVAGVGVAAWLAYKHYQKVDGLPSNDELPELPEEPERRPVDPSTLRTLPTTLAPGVAASMANMAPVRLSGELRIRGIPDGARVFIDDFDMSVAHGAGWGANRVYYAVPSYRGQHNVRVVAPGGASRTGTYVMTRGIFEVEYAAITGGTLTSLEPTADPTPAPVQDQPSTQHTPHRPVNTADLNITSGNLY